MKRLLLLSITAIMSMAMMADPIGKERATSIASQYAVNGVAPRLVHSAHRAPASTDQTTPPLYIFSRGNDAGFVIVSGDDCLPTVLGITDCGEYDAAQLPPALNDMIATWAFIVEQAQANGTNHPLAPQQAYGSKDIKPLVTAHWGQGDPFNRLCPYIGTGVTRAITGCVATAGAMIAYFWKDECYDCVQVDTPLYQSGRISVNEEVQLKAGTPYHWEWMQDNYDYYNGTSYSYSDDSANATATLMAALGMSSHLIYTSSETGGYYTDLRVAMLQQVGLACDHVYKNAYSDDEWGKLLYSTLADGLPMAYSGASASGGHAFICDGYRVSDNKFHFNFGWQGMGDGYFTSITGDPEAIGGWINNNNILYHFTPVHPNISATVKSATLTCGQENTITVNINSKSRAAYSGLYLMVSPDVVDIASTQTAALYNNSVTVPSGQSANIDFTFTPTTLKPHNYIVCDNNGGILARGTFNVTGTDPGTTEDFQPYVVTSLDQIEDGVVYTLCLNTFTERRGYLSTESTSISADDGKITTRQRFAIIKTDRGYYIYNPTNNRFVSCTNKSMGAKPKGALHLVKAQTDNRWLIVNPLTDACLQFDSEGTPTYVVTDVQDAGNQWFIEANAAANADKIAAAKATIAEYEANLPEGIAATGIELSSTMLSLAKGETHTLTANILPKAATDKDITWSTTNPAIVAVEDGVLTAVGEGIAAISATCGDVIGKCQVVVTDTYDKSTLSAVNKIDDRVLYSFGTDGRGYLTMGRSYMLDGTRTVGDDQQFVILTGQRGYYLWCPARQCFVPAGGSNAVAYPIGAYEFVPSNARPGTWRLRTQGSYWMQHQTGGRFVVNNWNEDYEGSQWIITPLGLANADDVAEGYARVEAYESNTLRDLTCRDPYFVMSVDDIRLMTVSPLPSGASMGNLQYTSSDESVATVDGAGMIKAVALGDALITASNGDIVTTCQVSVKEAFQEYTVTALDQITDGHVYTFNLGKRGYLTYGEPTMGDGVDGKAYEDQRFLMMKGAKGYYIWNIAGGKFVPAKDNYVLDVPNGSFTLSPANTANKWIITSTANNNWMQHGGSNQFLINDSWKIQDDGNRWTIAAVDRLIESEYAAARQTIDDYELTVGNTITNANSVRDGIAYLLFTPRGSMMMTHADGRMKGSCVVYGFARDAADPFQQWGIFKINGDFYIYNIGEDYVFGYANEEGTIIPEPLQIVKHDNAFMLMDSKGRFVNIGTGYTDGIAVNDWFTPDDGNLFTICKTADKFDYADIKSRIQLATSIPTLPSVHDTTVTGLHDLQGRRITTPTHGLYIINGKKIYVK